jgi:aminomethyltransferase
LQRTALFEAHQKLGARLVDFGGWQMPVQYTGIIEEHKAVREAAGVFDISHMGEFFVRGAGAGKFSTASHQRRREARRGQGQYTLMLNEQGGVIDDLIVYRLGREKYFLVVNAAKIDEDREWIRKRLSAGVQFDDSAKLWRAGAAGPKALEIAGKISARAGRSRSGTKSRRYSWNCQEILVARTGYTGEDGIEIFFKNEIAENFFLALLEAGKPLRPEAVRPRRARYAAAGSLPAAQRQRSFRARTPLEAGLGFFVALTKAAIFPARRFCKSKRAKA